MKRTILLLTLALVLAIGVLAVGCDDGDDTTTTAGADTTVAPDTTMAPGETISLTFSCHNPPGNAVATGLEKYAEYIETESNGMVEIDVQVGGALYSNQEIFDGLRTGGADCGSYVPDDGDGFYYNTVMSLPFVAYDDDVHATEVFWTLYEEFPQLEQEYLDLGLIKGTCYMMPPFQLHFHDDVVVTTPDDLKGKTLISLESYIADWLQMLGASVEQPAFPDLFPMVETQAADGICIHYNFLGGLQIAPAFTSHTNLGPGGMVMAQIGAVWNKDSFESLPADIQQIALDGQQTYIDTIIPGSKVDYNLAMDHAAAEGDTITELTPEQVEPWKTALASVYQEWIDGAPDPAVAQQMYDRLMELTQ